MVALLLVLSVIGAIGCEAAEPPASTAADTASPDPAGILDASATRMSGITFATFDLSHDVGSSYLSGLGLYLDAVTGQIAMPDKYSLRMEATTSDKNVFVGVEIIGVAGKAYMNLLGRWGETDPLTLPFDFSELGLRLADIMKAIEEPTLVGEEQVEGAQVWRIGGVVDSGAFKGLLVNASPGEQIEIDAWIGKDDSLLRQARVEGRLFSDDQSGAVRVLIIRDVDVPVEIELPPL